MVLMSDTVLQRVTSVVLTLYVGAFFTQALCVLHSSHMGAGVEDHPVTHASPSTTAPSSSTTALSSSMAAHNASQHGEHSGAHGESHSGVCAVVACASAMTAGSDYGPGLMSRVSNPSVAYLGSTLPPEAEMVPPPPRLG
jgi:hypothetical protein